VNGVSGSCTSGKERIKRAKFEDGWGPLGLTFRSIWRSSPGLAMIGWGRSEIHEEEEGWML
jgi:hypothetical protein